MEVAEQSDQIRATLTIVTPSGPPKRRSELSRSRIPRCLHPASLMYDSQRALLPVSRSGIVFSMSSSTLFASFTARSGWRDSGDSWKILKTWTERQDSKPRPPARQAGSRSFKCLRIKEFGAFPTPRYFRKHAGNVVVASGPTEFP